jgi:hypothetical protein
VIENYLDEGRRRQETRQAMDKRLGDLFAGIQPDE